MKTSLNF